MKITKRKWEREPPLFFYRDAESGKLVMQGDKLRDFTDTLFSEKSVKAVFERSLKSRLLKSCDKDGKRLEKNEITELVESLCKKSLCKDTRLKKSIEEVRRLPPKTAIEQCNKSLSGYGKSFTAPGSTKTLHAVLLDLINGNDVQKAMAEAELEKIHQALIKGIDHRINRVRNSIKGNKIPLIIKDDGSIAANNDRAAWLLELLQPAQSIHSSQPGYKADFYPVLTEMERIFSFEKLSREIRTQTDRYNGKAQLIAKAADETLRNYLRDLWEKYPDRHRDMKYYFQAVHEYFRENFPIRRKREGARNRQELLANKDALSRLLEPKHIENAVRRKLINQCTQINILYGKLYEYCCKSDNMLTVDSETLQRIQVLEAVKKQAMTAVLWSISRLRYFYENNYKDISKIDILSDKQEVKDFRKKFLTCNTYSDEFVQACKEKLQDFFPLEVKNEKCNCDGGQKYKDAEETCKDIEEIFSDDRKLCNGLLMECVFYIRSLRLKIFHYKNMSFTQALKKIVDEVEEEENKNEKEKKNILLHLYKRDRNNLNKAFAYKISSMNIPLYYRDDLLSRIFTKDGAEFSLYSANNQMTPSFRRVYERGKNLRLEWERKHMNEQAIMECDEKNSLENECYLKWFKQLNNTYETDDTDAKAGVNTDDEACANVYINEDVGADTKADTEDTNADAQRAVRNLLQLIYKHHFLPEVQKNDALVTSKISKVLERNKKLAEERSEKQAEKRSRALKIEWERPREVRNFAYKEVVNLYREGMPLSDFLEELQRKISETEKENRELAQNKADYAQRFIREVFAEAFNSFMQERYGDVYDEIMNPQKNTEQAKKWIEIDDAVNLCTTFDKNEIEKYLLVLYPVMRLLDEKELSELQQQMLRLRASMSEWQGETDFSEDIKIAEKIEELAELVKLTEPDTKYAEETWKSRAQKEFEQFVEGSMSDYGTFYLHSNKSNPVIRRNMTRLLRSGAIEVYKRVLSSRKQATKSDYDIYCGRQWVMEDSDGRYITFVEYAQRVLQQLHSKYAVSPSRFSEADHKSYDNILQWLEEYNQAKRNLDFGTLYETCGINMEILSRWVGFVQDWERDMYFLLLAWVKQGKLYQIKEEDVEGIFAKGNVIRKLFDTLKDRNMDAFKSVYCLCDDTEMNFVKVRNDIAHLDLLRSSNWTVGENQSGSVMEWYINRLRSLLSYDQKRMNAVTKTMQEIFRKHNIEVKFTMERGGKLKFKEVKPECIEHLKKSRFREEMKIEISSRGERFLSNLEGLMKYS